MSNLAVTVNPTGSGSGVTYVHTDGLSRPVARSNAAGAATPTPTIGFTGHVDDAETGLLYMQQRYYDPVAGRFLSIDPMTTDSNTGASFSRYVYANNSRYKYIDLDGRDAMDWVHGAFTACSGLRLKVTVLAFDAFSSSN